MAQSLGVVPRTAAGQLLACRLCGSTPAARVTIHEHNGRIAWMVHKQNKGPFCRDCGIALFRQHQNSTMYQGWFGFFSFFLTPLTLLINLVTWLRLRSLAPPHREASVTSRIPAPLNPGKPLLSRIGPYVALAVAVFVGSILYLGPANTPTRGQTTSPQITPTASASPTTQGSPVPSANPFPRQGNAFGFTSSSGDYIGQGNSELLTPPDWRFAVNQSLLSQGYVSVDLRSGSGSGLMDWTVDLAAARGQSLQPGTYPNAMRAAFRQGDQPGLEVAGVGRGCNQVFGSFTLTSLVIGTDGQIQLLDATFVQHCESPTAPALTGHIRYAWTAETTTSPPASASTGPFPATGDAYSFTSESGDYIGQGQAETLAPSTWSFSTQGNQGAGEVTIDIRNGSGIGLVDWTIDLAAPRGQSLQPGTYPSAMRAAFRQGTQPGIDVYGDGRGCNTVYGTFTVTQFEMGTAGQVTAFEATFVQHCETANAPALYGHIRYLAPS
jgi:hypothetical protein